MRDILRLIEAAYGRLLRLYPPDFHKEFGAEMQIVFHEAAQEAVRHGWARLVGLCWREARDWPAALWLARRHSRDRKAGPMMGTSMGSPAQPQPRRGPANANSPGDWNAALLAGMPHALIAVLSVAGWLLATRGAVVALTAAGLVLAGACLVAGRAHWPRWWASWAGYLFLVVVLFLLQPFQNWQPLMRWQFTAILLIVPLLGAGMLLWAVRRDPLGGLLVALPLVLIVWAPVTEFIPGSLRGPLMAGAFILAGLTSATIVRRNDVRLAVWLGLGLSLVVGACAAYLRTYWHTVLPEYPPAPTVAEMVELFTPQWLASATLIVGPLLAWGTWRMGAALGRAGKLAAGALIGGGMLNLVGHLAYFWRSLEHFGWTADWYALGKTGTPAMVDAGLVLAVAGGVWLAAQMWRTKAPLGGAWGVVIGLVVAGLPLMFMLPSYFGFTVTAGGLWFGFYNLAAPQKYMLFGAGLGWLLLAGWLVSRLSALAASGPGDSA